MTSASIFDFNTAAPLAHQEARARRHEVDAEDVKARITADAEGFVRWLFSGRALIARGEARIGDVHGTPGASLSVRLAGPNTGLWTDHATGEGGDLIGLFQAHMGYEGNRNFALAVKEIAAEFLGDAVPIQRTPFQPTVAVRIAEKREKLGTSPRQDMVDLGAPVATWKYQDADGNMVASVVRYEPDGTPVSKTFRPYHFKTVDGQRRWSMGAPALRPLYRLNRIAHASVVVLCEGEKAAQALADIGIEATTAMQGAKAPIEKTDWSPLHGKTVIVWPDNDEPGLAYGRAAVARLSSLGCPVRLVEIPVGAPPRWDAADAVAEGRDVADMLARSIPLAAVERPRIRILDIDDLEDLPPPIWLVEHVLPLGALGVLWGRSGDLKSWVANDLCMRIATGTPWFGRETRRGLVLYVAAEGAYGFGSRVRAWRQFKGEGLPKPLFKLIPHAVAITGEDLDHMVAAILALDARPSLIVLDTLARTFGVGDENKQADMNAYVTAADRLRDATGATVLIVHHSGVGDGQRERGSSVLRGAADTMIKVARDGDRLRLVNRTPEGKQKDAEEFDDIRLRVQKVVYEHADIEHSTLLLMEDDDPLPNPSENPARNEPPKFGRVASSIIDALKRAEEPLGLTRLTLMTNAKKNSVAHALAILVEKQVVERLEIDPQTSAWRLL